MTKLSNKINYSMTDIVAMDEATRNAYRFVDGMVIIGYLEGDTVNLYTSTGNYWSEKQMDCKRSYYMIPKSNNVLFNEVEHSSFNILKRKLGMI
tara:strand:+ start:75 stop:356 length:282 start_codon:yes stop_codon:yes gene_type:complete